MACENEIAVVLREVGQKVTPQRVHILCEVRHSGVHITASRLIEELHTSHPFIDASTVYRTLASAADLGLVYETDLGSGESEFEWVGKDRHHHLICRTCGEVTSLDNSYLDSVATLLYEEAGFQADLGHFAIFGVCKGCRAKA